MDNMDKLTWLGLACTVLPVCYFINFLYEDSYARELFIPIALVILFAIGSTILLHYLYNKFNQGE
jgi:hypothetical protein